MEQRTRLMRDFRERFPPIIKVYLLALIVNFLDVVGICALPDAKASSEFQSSVEAIGDRVRAASTKPVPVTADAVLVRTREWKWNRYLKSALNLPDWLDLGLEYRTRFGVYDHPWRSNQPLGRTDPQIELRSRLRFGLNGPVFKFLFEGQDSRTHLDDPGDFVNDTIVNEWDILQLLGLGHRHKRVGNGPSRRSACWSAYYGFWPTLVNRS